MGKIIPVAALFAAVLALSGFYLLRTARNIPASEIAINNYSSPEKSSLSLEKLEWREATSSGSRWSARDAHAAFVFDNKLWIAGGLDANPIARGNYVPYWKADHKNDIWYSENGIDWIEARANAEWLPRRSLSIVPFSGKLIMLDGWSPVGGYSSDVWESSDGIHWSTILSNAPWEPREGQNLIVLNDKLWMMGGINFDKRKFYNDVWSSPDGINWEEITPNAEWAGRYDQAAEVFKGKMWVTGGLVPGGSALNDVWSSEDGINWKLEVGQAPWSGRHGHGLLAYKDNLWIISGWDTKINKGSSEVWYSPDGANWKKTGAAVPWLGREDHATAVFLDKLWVMGGMNSDWRWTNDIWYSSLSR